MHDARAVAVHTLGGTLVGWVPKAENERFQSHELVFGRVDFVGSVPGSDIWGARVVAQPALLPAHVSPFPWQLLPSPSGTPAAGQRKGGPASGAGRAATAPSTTAPPSSLSGGAPTAGLLDPDGLQRAVGPKLWQQWSEAAGLRSKGRCEVTGASSTDVQLELVPIWQYNDHARVAKVRAPGHFWGA